MPKWFTRKLKNRIVFWFLVACCIFLVFILAAGIFGMVTGVTIYEDTELYAGGWTLTVKETVDFGYLEIGENYTNTSYDSVEFFNITYADNLSSSRSLVEQNGFYSLGNYTTRVIFDLYAPSDWTVDNVYVRFDTNTSQQLDNISNPSYTQFNSTHRRFNFSYNPSNTIDIDWVTVQVDIWAKAYNDTLSYRGCREFDNQFEVYELDPVFNDTSTYFNDTNYNNITWNDGNYSDRDVLVGEGNEYPSDPDDGTVYFNGTDNFYNFSVNETQYFTLFSYNDTTHSFSDGVDVTWGVVQINVFNASKTWQKIDPFGLIIQNQDGDEIYRNTTVTPPLYLNVDDIPFGEDTIFIINSSGFKQQSFTRDTLENHFHNYTFLLPPIETSTPGEGDPDSGGDPTNATDTLLYLISIVDELSNPVPNANVEFNLYRNESDSYEQSGSFLTDGNGQGTINLVPDKLYQVIVSKTNYQTDTSYWTPSRDLLVKTFMLEYEEDEPTEPDVSTEEIVFTFERAGTTLYINYTDAMEETLNTTVYVYGINTSTNVETLLTTDERTEDHSFSFTITNINTSHAFKAVLYYNHSTFNAQTITLVLHGDWDTPDQGSAFNTLVVALIGSHPWGWANFLMFMFVIAVFHQADNRDAGKWLVLIGGLFLLINVVFGWSSTLFSMAGGVLPTLFVAVGILQMWKDSKRKEAS